MNCATGYVPKDLNLSSVEAHHGSLHQTRMACEVAAKVNANTTMANDVIVQNIEVSNLLMLPPIAAGMFTFSGMETFAGAGTFFSSLPLTQVLSNDVVASGSTINVNQDGIYLFTLNFQGSTTANTTDIAVYVDGVLQKTLITTIDTTTSTYNASTELSLLSGQTISFAYMAAGALDLNVDFGRIVVSQISTL